MLPYFFVTLHAALLPFYLLNQQPWNINEGCIRITNSHRLLENADDDCNRTARLIKIVNDSLQTIKLYLYQNCEISLKPL